MDMNFGVGGNAIHPTVGDAIYPPEGESAQPRASCSHTGQELWGSRGGEFAGEEWGGVERRRTQGEVR